MTATPDGHDGESFRVTHHGCWIGYARSVPELERWIELADLEDALILAVGQCPRSFAGLGHRLGLRLDRPARVPRPEVHPPHPEMAGRGVDHRWQRVYRPR
jgi:hypothetical protein